jgi:hypothetical protein
VTWLKAALTVAGLVMAWAALSGVAEPAAGPASSRTVQSRPIPSGAPDWWHTAPPVPPRETGR